MSTRMNLPLIIMFGSQKGTAKGIAEAIHDEAVQRGFNSTCVCANEFKSLNLESCEVPIVIVTSTTGAGDPPHNVEDFWRFIHRRTHPKGIFSKCRYTILGIGDTNYDDFCGAAKAIHRRLKALGATTFYDIAYADEVYGLENTIDPWTAGLWPSIVEQFGSVQAPETKVDLPRDPLDWAREMQAIQAERHQRSIGHRTYDAAHEDSADPSEAGPLPGTRRKSVEKSSFADAIASATSKEEKGRARTKSNTENSCAETEELILDTTGKTADEVLEMAALMAAKASTAHRRVRIHRAISNPDELAVSATSTEKDKESPSKDLEARLESKRTESPIVRRKLSVDTSAPVPNSISNSAAHLADVTKISIPISPPVNHSGFPSPASNGHFPSAASNIAADAWELFRRITPAEGVKSFFELFPTLKASSTNCEGTNNVALPAASTYVGMRFFPSVPQCTLLVTPVMDDTSGFLPQSSPKLIGSTVVSPTDKADAPSGAATVSSTVVRVTSSISEQIARSRSASPKGSRTPMSVGAASAGRSQQAPVPVTISSAKYLTSDASFQDRRVLSISFDVSNTPLYNSWSPGDSVGILAPNLLSEAAALCWRLGHHPLTKVFVANKTAKATQTPTPSIPTLRPTVPSSNTNTPHSPPMADGQGPIALQSSWIHATVPGAPFPYLVDVFTWCSEIMSFPAKSKSIIRLLAESCNDSEEGQWEKEALLYLASKAGAEAYSTLIECQRLTFLDLLNIFPAAMPSISQVLSCLPTLAPRYYSLTCSPLIDPAKMTIAFTVVEYTCGVEDPSSKASSAIRRLGLATSYLEKFVQPLLHSKGVKMDSPPTLCLFLRPARDFVPPPTTATPMIMIGPGTGVAPFIGFLEHRQAKITSHEELKVAICTGYWRGLLPINCLEEDAEQCPPLIKGDVYLFAGNRHRKHDFLFEEDLLRFEKTGVLTKLVTAFSRDGTEKVYVQHRMRECAEEIAKLVLQDGAIVYVCGDGTNMAKDVRSAMIDIIHEHSAAYGQPLSRKEAETHLSTLVSSKRYLEDIWS